MAYVFDFTTNTLIDDEDKSFGNKLALNDDEFQKLLDIPGVFRASEAPIPPPRQEVLDREAINRFMRDNKAEGGRIRQNFVAAGLAMPFASALSYPASYGLATLFGLSTTGGAKILGDRVTNHIKDNPEILNDPRFKAAALSFGINLPGYIAPDADEMEREKEKIREMTKPVGFPAEPQIDVPLTTGEKPEVKIDTKETFPAETEKLPFKEEFPIEDKQLPIIFENRKQESPKKRGQKKIEDLNPDTVSEVKNIINDYRAQKTNPGKTQPTMTMGDKTELVNLVLNKFNEKEKRLPIYSEVVGLMPQISNLSEVIQYGQIKLPKGKADFDRTDPQYVELMNNKFQTKAIEQNTITNFKDKSFFPETVTLKDGNIVNAKEFFEKNLAERINYGPGRKGNPALQNKDLAKLFNTNVRKIEETVKKIKNNPNFKADYPPKRDLNYGNQQATLRLKEARKYVTESELTNIKIQEKNLNNLNTKFKKGELIVTDYPNLVKALNTTLDKETGILDHSIKKTKKEMIERSKDNSGLFDISHTIPKTSGQKNIEFLKNRNILDYKTNQGLFKSMESYVKNKMDDPDYDLRLEEFDNYMKEMNQLVKIGNRFFGKEQAMINSETGELLGINSQLEYFGLPKFKNGVPLKKIKKADGGPIELSPLPRINFNGGGAAGADVDFATQLEYFLTNEDAELPQLSTYKETKNPIEVFNDIIDPRNYPYYADVLARSGVRIGEFGAKVLPATGKLISDLIQKPAFKIKETGNNYVQDYTDVLPSNIKGTGIFSEFLENITPTSLEKKIGLASLIEKEEQKQIDRGSTAGPKVFADTIGLGAEVTAPIFPGLKLLRAYAKNRNLPVDNVTKKILVKEIDEVLETQGMNRREFLQTTGAGATVILAKMLGFGDEVAQTAKVVEKAAAAPAGVPPYFFQLAEIIKKKGFDVTKGNATKNLENVYSYNGYDLYEDIATGEIRIEKIGKESDMVTNREILEYTPGRADETTKSKPADSYEEVTETNSRIYKDRFNEPNYEEGIDIEEILEFIKNEKAN